MIKKTSFFLGANTPKGFVSFFDELYNPYQPCNAYILKGGPGTGKSTFMKKAAKEAEKRGYSVQYIYCSSDPESLDAIIVPELNLSIADGTAPHVLEPKFPGVAENIIHPGQFWDTGRLKKVQNEIRTLTIENSLHHRRSSAYLSAAGKLCDENRRLCHSFIREEKINSFAVRFAARECEKKKSLQPGRAYKRFLSGITPEGIVYLDDTVSTLCTRVIGIDDEHGAVSQMLCQRCAQAVMNKGYDVILCHCPIRPEECEHIIIPELSLCIMTLKKNHTTKIQCDRIIHSSRFMTEGIEKYKKRLRFNRTMAYELILQSIDCLKKAKGVHDELEGKYVEAMDFDALNSFCEKIIEEMFSINN